VRLVEYDGQGDALPNTYTSANGNMTATGPAGSAFSVDHTNSEVTWTVGTPAGGVTTVFTPSLTAIPTWIRIGDQRASTYRNISATCLNPATMAIEPCNLGDTATFPRTNATPAASGTYSYLNQWSWWSAPTSILQAWTPPGGGSSNQQSNGGWINLPPYVRSITVTAYGAYGGDFSFTGIRVADAPSVSKVFAPTVTTPGSQSTLTITLRNPDLGAPVPGVNLRDQLPAPLRLVSATHTCTLGAGTFTADTATGQIALTNATLPAAGCAITATVEWPNDAPGRAACVNTPTITNTITPTTAATPGDFSTALGQMDTVAQANLSCSYTPQVSVACTPTELFDRAGQKSVCTITSDTPAGAAGLSVNLSLPATGNPRYTTTCTSPITLAAGQTSATCDIDATENTVVGDGDVTATVAIAAPTHAADYAATGAQANVMVRDDDRALAPVPVQSWPALLAMALGLLALGGRRLAVRRR
jgi:hypothetical protein